MARMSKLSGGHQVSHYRRKGILKCIKYLKRIFVKTFFIRSFYSGLWKGLCIQQWQENTFLQNSRARSITSKDTGHFHDSGLRSVMMECGHGWQLGDLLKRAFFIPGRSGFRSRGNRRPILLGWVERAPPSLLLSWPSDHRGRCPIFFRTTTFEVFPPYRSQGRWWPRDHASPWGDSPGGSIPP